MFQNGTDVHIRSLTLFIEKSQPFVSGDGKGKGTMTLQK